MHSAWHIRGARLLDPESGEETPADLWVVDGCLSFKAPGTGPCGTIVANGLYAAPGFVDVHVHFREPGNEAAETMVTGVQAAACGGFTTVVTMPNTQPPVDSADRVRDALDRAARAGGVRVLPAGCLTLGRAGREQADLADMALAGAPAFTDDGGTVPDRDVMRAAMVAARAANRPVLDHALDPALAGNGVLREGPVARRLGLPGIPAEAEVAIVRRDMALVEETGCRLHVQHLSTAGAIEILRAARARGLPVSGEATPHHLLLADADIPGNDAAFKMSPPLGNPDDREALQRAVADGTVTVFATDHAPHTAEQKERGFQGAPFGVVGLETAVGATYSLVVAGLLDRIAWVRRWTTGPAALLGLPTPSLQHGVPADLVLLDLDREWTVDPSRFHSRSRNTPFAGRRFTGRAVLTLVGGRVAWQDPGRRIANAV